MNATSTLMLTIFILGSFCIVDACGGSCVYQRYPAGHQCSSPNGRFIVENENRTGEPRHVLMLKDNENNTHYEIYSYDREASVVWAPDSKKILINNYAGSDHTMNLIFYIDEKKLQIDLKYLLMQHLTEKEKQTVENNDHVYLSGLEWIDNNNLRVIVWGHGSFNPEGFCKCYILKISGGIRQCEDSFVKKKIDSEEYCEKIKN